MEAGQEMNALVAEKVFGWRAWINDDGEWRVQQPGERICGDGECLSVSYDARTGEKHTHPWWRYFSPPGYSYDIAHAWDVVEKLGERYGVRVDVLRHARVVCSIGEKEFPDIASASDISATLAICRAALKAVK